MLNPVFIAFIISIPLNLLNVKSYVPEIETYSGWLNNLVTPLSLGRSSVIRKVRAMPTTGKSTNFAKLTTYIRLLENMAENLILCAFICFATPTAALASTFADQNGGDSQGAAIYTLGTTLLSVITIPLLYMALVAIL